MEAYVKKLILAVLLYFSFSVSASASGGLMGTGQIQNMQSAYGGWLIFMSGTNANPDTCPQNIVFLDPSMPQYKELFAVLWTAQIAKTPINIYVAGCNAPGYKLLYFVVTG